MGTVLPELKYLPHLDGLFLKVTATVRWWEQTSLLHHTMMCSHTHTVLCGMLGGGRDTYQGPEHCSLDHQPVTPYSALPHINAYAAGHDTGIRQLVPWLSFKTRLQITDRVCDIVHRRYSFLRHMCIDPIHIHYKVQPPLMWLFMKYANEPLNSKVA
jgi:hypothetical protein